MNIKRFAVTLTLFATLVVSPEMAQAQVFGSGPSDSSLFDTVINLPPDPDIGFSQSIDGGTQLNVADGGQVGEVFDANDGSEVNISGGSVGSRFQANSGSEVNISGGRVGVFFDANDGSEVNISGGTVGCAFDANSGSVVELLGGEFRLNGDAFTGQTITLAEDEVFSGTLADGSSFIFASRQLDFVGGMDRLSGVRLSAAPLPVVDATPMVIDSPVTEGPFGLRSGQTLTLVEGGSLRDNFAVVDATLNVQGGTLGSFVETAGSVVNISGGTVGSGLQAYSGSEVNISGGTVGDQEFNIVTTGVGAGSGSVVNVSGGNVRGLEAASGSVVNITGGTVGAIDLGAIIFGGPFFSLDADSGSEVNISGGNVVGIGFFASDGSEVNISGTQFLLNGQLLDALVVGESFTITEPIETLTGILADGSPFSYGLGRLGFLGFPRTFSPGATITVTLSAILGDVNLDGVVDFLDISPFIAVLSAGGFQDEADIDRNGVVNFLDITPFIEILIE